MNSERKNLYLRYALLLFGILFLFIYPLMHFWPSGWQWQPAQYEYEQMIVGVYATLGVFLLKASRNPLQNASLIWFTVWSSIVHATIMLLQVFFDRREFNHIYGDIPALYLIAFVLAYLMTNRQSSSES